MLGEQTKNMLIGAFIIVSCALFVSFILFLRPSVGDEGQTLTFRFTDINNIGIGTRVLFAGRPVGEVVSITEIPEGRDPKVDELDRVYTYQLKVKIDSSVRVFTTDEVTIQTSGLLGEKSIGIVPKAPAAGVIPKRITTEPIYANAVDPLENALVQISGVADEMERAFKLAADWIEENEKTMTSAITNFSNAAGEIHDAMVTLREKQAFSNFADSIANFKITTKNLADGQGTLGRLVNEDDLYIRFSAMMSKLDTILNDVNHYGLLFHSNKGWQRTRQKRITELNALDTPAGFRSYMEGEVSSINLSMARLRMLLERAESEPEFECVMDSNAFKKDFQQLKSEVDALAENLQLFNQQLSEECTP